jgi:phage baseplate assembly protein W
MKSDHEERLSQGMHAGSESNHPTDFVAIGQGLVFSGELIGASGAEWRVRIDHFLIGDLSELIDFSERFSHVDPYDRYILVNALGDGRQLTAAPKWEKTHEGYVVSCAIRPSFPRTNVHRLPADLALNEAHDLFLVNGDLAVVSGLDALPQKIKMCLSTLRGEVLFHRNFGTRIKEYFDDLKGSPWLPRLVKLEVIRLACIPYSDPVGLREYTPMHSVKRVRSVDRIASDAEADWQPFRFLLEVEGVGPWQCDISIFIPRGQRPHLG